MFLAHMDRRHVAVVSSAVSQTKQIVPGTIWFLLFGMPLPPR